MAHPVQAILEERAGRSPRRQQTSAVVAAVALHALLVATAVALPRLTETDREFPDYVAVQVVPAQALGIERPKPPAPQPRPAPQPPPAPAPPEPDEEVPSLPAQKPKKPAPEPQPPAPEAAAPGETPGPPGSPEGSPTAGPYLGFSAVGPEGTAFPYDYYLEQMLGQIRQNWVRPPARGIEALISFRVLRDGQIADAEIRRGSGSRAFDLAALRAVHNASPLPPLPSSYQEDVLTVNLIVR